ncbi:tRNA pseudouridine(55) synthase TruB [Alcaligenaceae bacterium LF4-65]|jgi:tRNA pseudouridine55 synthase|uniref:tRNA pseudouridine synthase B n=1 Tax=Zwartia hollandica TaxID=324606 RepID=A0A953NCF5_9BURK|nr:tRNA pseudouridine(55) synthase TruB [Zwartia hollandica]MBZ1350686.1 tRNA pseudouridine(55) synthase TruB [Zwartia hollandica]
MAKRRGRVLDGVLLLDKPVGLSSNHALQRAKRAMDAQKAGHTGTLDPFATGLLVCCMGRATKISGAMLNADKSYLATIAFGRETDSGDLTGIVVNEASADFEGVSQERLNTVLDSFVGTQLQIPPMISALKRDGKPLYEYARQGIVLEREPREITIRGIELLEATPTSANIHVHCTKGTYIRTLAQDIGRVLGCYAHLSALRRTRVGPFMLDAAIELEALQAMEAPESMLIAMNDLPEGLVPPAKNVVSLH